MDRPRNSDVGDQIMIDILRDKDKMQMMFFQMITKYLMQMMCFQVIVKFFIEMMFFPSDFAHYEPEPICLQTENMDEITQFPNDKNEIVTKKSDSSKDTHQYGVLSSTLRNSVSLYQDFILRVS